MRVVTVVGTRPEIIRLSEVIKTLDRLFDHKLVHTGQNWDPQLSAVFFSDLDLRQPDYWLKCPGVHLGETIGNIISRSYALLQEIKPDALLILGDTNSSLCAIAAKRLKIPIFHMEAGNRCFDQNVPEEINRKLVDHMSDVNIAYTEHSRRYLLGEGFAKDRIFVCGSPMTEVLAKNQDKIAASNVLERLNLKPGGYILLSTHREENIDSEANFVRLFKGIEHIAATYSLPIIFSCHPRTTRRLEERAWNLPPLVRKMEPFNFSDYNNLQMHAFCVLSDSGTLSEESALLGFPAVLVRTSTERPEVLDKGTIVIGGIAGNQLAEAIHIAVTLHADVGVKALPPDYADINTAQRIARIIISYTHLVDMFTWRKEEE